MPDITLKGIPPRLHKGLRARAARHRRSLNSEAIACLEQVVLGGPPDIGGMLDRARELRARFNGRTTVAEMERLINTGRR